MFVTSSPIGYSYLLCTAMMSIYFRVFIIHPQSRTKMLAAPAPVPMHMLVTRILWQLD